MDELLAENPATIIRLIGCNQIGAEAGNPSICAGRDTPWTQDTAAENVWVDWNVTYRDVIILDVDNIPVDVYNLTSHDLANPANYAELKQRLKDAAGE
ncbi:MAG: hypothetical protein ACHQ1G_03985 [Planctomycetota bacterium]